MSTPNDKVENPARHGNRGSKWSKPGEKFPTFSLTSRQCLRRQVAINFTEGTSFYKPYMENLPRQQDDKQTPSLLTELSSKLRQDKTWPGNKSLIYQSMKKTRSNTTMIGQTHNQVPQDPTTDSTVAASLRTLTLCLDQLLNREPEEAITYDGDEPAAHFFSQLESQPNFHDLEPARQARKALSSLRGEPRKIAQDLALLNKTCEQVKESLCVVYPQRPSFTLQEFYELKCTSMAEIKTYYKNKGITPALKLPNNDHRARAEHLPPPWTRPHHILAVTVADNTGTHSVSSEGPTSGHFGPSHLWSTTSSNTKDRLGLQVSTRPQQRRAREKPSNANFGSRTPPKLNELTCTLNQQTPLTLLQIFFVEDAQLEVNQRCHFSSALRHALENMPSDEYKLVIRADKTPSGEHERRFNAPQKSTNNEPDEDKNVYNLRPTPEQGFYYWRRKKKINQSRRRYKANVNFNNIKSKTTDIYQGLPQGSILSPILFNIYLNDVHTFIKPPVKNALYVDNIIIWVSKNNLSDAEQSLNKAMKGLQKGGPSQHVQLPAGPNYRREPRPQQPAWTEMIYSSSHLPEEDAHIWNLDSGCTSHMSPREDWLINKIPIDNEINLAEEERFIKAEAQGDVKLSTYTIEEGTSFYKPYMENLPRQQDDKQTPSLLTELSSKLYSFWKKVIIHFHPRLHSTAPAVAESGGGYIERASLFLRRRLEDDTARSDYPSLSDLGRSLRARRRSPSTFTDDNAISGGQLRRFLLDRLSSRFAQAPSSEEAIADFLAKVTPLEFDEWDQLFLADISREQIAAAIHRLPNGRASGWDGLPCEFVKAFEDFFAEVLWQVFEASRLRGALPPSSRRSKVILLPKVHGGPGLQAFWPISLLTTDYRVLSGMLMARLRRHLPDLVPQCQTYAVPGRSSSWNIARVSDEAAGARAPGGVRLL
ncbi:hypothetical protein LAZ67_23001547 [Cordylochernes scorpioides]|uniref:Reverse transcriptase domain-containing protein n=1 Tax=Cordylochernes scorpioides TaxID=51811 RepID=A0ABY6LQT0_9ARAC|nr:hypothetical protein LAZ67_23001547 [Cordylochernes scorpioides]